MAGTTIIYVYLGEFHSAKHRSIMIMATGLFVSLACVLLPGKLNFQIKVVVSNVLKCARI